MDARNVRLAIATDGFSPYGSNAVPYSCWPIVVIPYNLPPSMCMKKDFNILTMLISGPKSPGKCLNVFMRPLIDELKVLWDTGVSTWDRCASESFMMRAAVMWTISDFPGLGMLGGIQTKGYKACPACLDDIDASFSRSRMSYQGTRRWLPHDHNYRTDARAFNGKIERRGAPRTLSGREIYETALKHKYPVMTTHPHKDFGKGKQKLCWTHVSIFWELPYWTRLRVRHALDVMHIEKNVCDNVFGTVLGLDGKTKDDVKARKTLQDMGVRPHLWVKIGPSGKSILPQASYTVPPKYRKQVFDQITGVKYPRGYAGSLKNKVNVSDKKFYGLKTHDCHVLLQRILPIVIRPYLGKHVADAIVELSRFFKMLCARELNKSDVRQMQSDIILILCKLEMIFPPAFFTIMVHLCIHLPEQALLTGPVHYTWMFPIERQLGEYKKFVGNKRYVEGSIAERYIMHECVTYINLYLNNRYNGDEDIPEAPKWNISVVSDLIIPVSCIKNAGLSREEIITAHWMVMVNCVEAESFITDHLHLYSSQYPNGTLDHRIQSFNLSFRQWMNDPGRYNRELQILSCLPQHYNVYSQCEVNGVKFVSHHRDHSRKTQNSGVMVVADDISYYGILDSVVELTYTLGMTVVLFKCRWYDETHTKSDRGLISVDTSTNCYEDSPFCLAMNARQVFYVDDPLAGEDWKVVNIMSHRGTYTKNTLATSETVCPIYEVNEPYQEPLSDNIHIPISDLFMDLGPIPRVDISDDDDEDGEDYNDDEDTDEDTDDAEGFNNDEITSDENDEAPDDSDPDY